MPPKEQRPTGQELHEMPENLRLLNITTMPGLELQKATWERLLAYRKQLKRKGEQPARTKLKHCSVV
jgi:hypothetical protein